ncbi:MAG: DUF1570 domain-containing protein [Planctomycetia bacterium]
MRFVGFVICLGLAVVAPSAWERVRIAGDAGDRVVEGRVVVEAQDGSLLLEHPDQRLELVSGAGVRGREAVDAPPEPLAPRALGDAVLRTLPAGFDQVATRHYVVCFDTSRAYAQWCAALFERLHDAFMNFWRQAGFEVEEPARPLVVVIFADRQRYEAHAAADLGAATDRVVGYYNLLSNRVTTFDLTGSDLVGGRPSRSAGRAGLEILSSKSASGLVATLVHEATHQMAFNCGLHRRLAAVPLWVSEGVAIYFETPDVSSDRGWRGIGGVNGPRRERFVAGRRAGWFTDIVRSDESFRTTDEALDAYAGAWAATAFLVQTRKASFIDYLRTLAEKEPLVEDDADRRLQEFTAAFGAEPAALEDAIVKFVARLK